MGGGVVDERVDDLAQLNNINVTRDFGMDAFLQ